MTTLTTGTKGDGSYQQRADDDESEKTQRVSSAVKFLQDPRVKSTPVPNKVQFLKSKGLTTEEVCEAFEKAGQPTSFDGIKQLMNTPSLGLTGQNVSNPTPVSGHVTADSAYSSRQYFTPTYAGPLYTQQPPPFSHESQDAKESSWGDYILAIGAVLIGGSAIFKAFQTYSPYEIRRKDEAARPGPRGGSERRAGRKERRFSSDRNESFPRIPPRTAALPLPETPLSSVPASATATKATSLAAENAQEEVKRLQVELKETQEALEKEKRSKAELSVTLGKLRGQFLAQSRTNENLELKVKNLKEELDKMQNKTDSQNSVVGEGTCNASDEMADSQLTSGHKSNVSAPLSSEPAPRDADHGEINLNQVPPSEATEAVSEEK